MSIELYIEYKIENHYGQQKNVRLPYSVVSEPW